MLLIEHWYPGKYSVTCTLTVLPAMVARGTMLSRPAGSCTTLSAQKMRWLPGFSTSPAAGQSYGMGFTLQAALRNPAVCRAPSFSVRHKSLVARWVPVRGAPIQPLPASARCQSTQIRDPGARKKYLRPLGFRHVGGPQKHRRPIVATCRRPHTVIVEPGLIRHSHPDAPVLVKVVHTDGRSAN